MDRLKRLMLWLNPMLCIRCGQTWSRSHRDEGPAIAPDNSHACPCCGYDGRTDNRRRPPQVDSLRQRPGSGSKI